jgi:hypothetical protein
MNIQKITELLSKAKEAYRREGIYYAASLYLLKAFDKREMEDYEGYV